VAAIVRIELPKGQWKDLIDTLLNNITCSSTSAYIKQSTLQIIGYICESLVK
jgi:importin subunit beta-1